MNMKSQTIIAAAVLLCACGSETGDGIDPTPVVNSNSNWLVPCSDDVPCAEGSCFCGQCTRTCAAATDCGTERPDAACVTPEAQSLIDQCTGGTAPTESVCLPECMSDDECSSWQACRAGNCVAVEDAREPEVDDMDAVRPCPLDDGIYCGSEVRLEEAGLYQCDGRGITLLTRCTSGCTVNDRDDDVCTERLRSR